MKLRPFWRMESRGVEMLLLAIALAVAGCNPDSGSREAGQPDETDPEVARVQPEELAPGPEDEKPGDLREKPAEGPQERALQVPEQEAESEDEADEAWKGVVSATEMPSVPEEWNTNPPTQEELEGWKESTADQAVRGAEQARSFYQEYPDHPNAGEARQREYQLLDFATQLGADDQIERLEQLENQRLADDRVGTREKAALKARQVQREAMRHEGDLNTVAKALEDGARRLLKEYPNQPEVYQLLLAASQIAIQKGDLEKAREIHQEILERGAPEPIQKQVKKLEDKVDRLGSEEP